MIPVLDRHHPIYPKIQRYSFLSGFALRDDDEEREVHQLLADLTAAGVDTGWEIAPRRVPSGPIPVKRVGVPR